MSSVWGWDTDDFKSGWSNGGKEYLNNTENVYKAIRALEHGQAGQLVRDMLLTRDLAVNTYTANNAEPAALLAAAHELGVDAPAIRTELTKAAKAKEKEKADKAKKKAAKATKPARAQIDIPDDIDVDEPTGSDTALQPTEQASIDPAVLQDADTRRVFIAAHPERLNDLTPVVIHKAPHLLKALDVAGHETGYMWRDNEWHAPEETKPAPAAEEPAPRKTLTLKPKASNDPAAGADQAGPIVRVKKPPRVITLPAAVAYSSPNNAPEGGGLMHTQQSQCAAGGRWLWCIEHRPPTGVHRTAGKEAETTFKLGRFQHFDGRQWGAVALDPAGALALASTPSQFPPTFWLDN